MTEGTVAEIDLETIIECELVEYAWERMISDEDRARFWFTPKRNGMWWNRNLFWEAKTVSQMKKAFFEMVSPVVLKYLKRVASNSYRVQYLRKRLQKRAAYFTAYDSICRRFTVVKSLNIRPVSCLCHHPGRGYPIKYARLPQEGVTDETQ